ncbi:hypothetical protein O1611_g7622 [Lasiodiplodia mahajangana]|uniref:Uncharacterized protein n=1 Tax=Lasiodiplodia mahajangana TaxID=1108764 RepID=A0ACC2JF08_9PEZI|nr:hypothetical protein O1611_g7622 [Lasiodiplodia mahajangana]
MRDLARHGDVSFVQQAQPSRSFNVDANVEVANLEGLAASLLVTTLAGVSVCSQVADFLCGSLCYAESKPQKQALAQSLDGYMEVCIMRHRASTKSYEVHHVNVEYVDGISSRGAVPYLMITIRADHIVARNNRLANQLNITNFVSKRLLLVFKDRQTPYSGSLRVLLSQHSYSPQFLNPAITALIRFIGTVNTLHATTRTRALQGQRRVFVAPTPFRTYEEYSDSKGGPVAKHPEK